MNKSAIAHRNVSLKKSSPLLDSPQKIKLSLVRGLFDFVKANVLRKGVRIKRGEYSPSFVAKQYMDSISRRHPNLSEKQKQDLAKLAMKSAQSETAPMITPHLNSRQKNKVWFASQGMIDQLAETVYTEYYTSKSLETQLQDTAKTQGKSVVKMKLGLHQAFSLPKKTGVQRIRRMVVEAEKRRFLKIVRKLKGSKSNSELIKAIKSFRFTTSNSFSFIFSGKKYTAIFDSHLLNEGKLIIEQLDWSTYRSPWGKFADSIGKEKHWHNYPHGRLQLENIDKTQGLKETLNYCSRLVKSCYAISR